MADSAVPITAGAGTNIDTRTEATNGNHRQVINIGDPSVNAGVAPVDATAGLKVDLGADNDVTVTGNVAVTHAALTELAGAIDTEMQVDIVGALPAGNNNIGDVDVASSALPTGASTSAKQDTMIGHLDGVEGLLTTIDGDTGTIAGAVSGTEMQVDVVAALPAGNNNIGDVDVASLPALPAGNNNIGDVDVASIAAGDNNIGNVDIVTMPNVTLAAGTNTNEVVGDVAHDAAVGGNPVLVGAEARDTLGTAVATGDAVRLVANRYGHVLTTAQPPSHASSNGTPIAATTTSVIAAPGASTHLRIVRIHMSNGGSTASWCSVRDGAAGTQHYRTYLMQGAAISLNLASSGPLDLTTATRLDIVMSAAGSLEYEIDYLTVAD